MKTFRRLVFALVILIFSLTLLGCNKKPKNVSDIFHARTSSKEFNKLATITSLPDNYKIYESDDGQSGYIEKEDVFILEKVRVTNSATNTVVSENVLNVVSAKKPNKLILDEDLRPKKVLVKHGYIAILGEDKLVSVYNMKGQVVLSKAHFDQDAISNSKKSLEDIIKIADTNTFVVSSAYLKNAKDNEAKMFAPSTTGDVSSRGRLLGKIANPSNVVNNVSIVDNQYAIVKETEKKEVKGHTIWNFILNKELVKYMKGASNKDYEQKLSYLGLGQFYIEYSYEGTKDKHNIVLKENKYRQMSSFFYDANTNSVKDNSTKYFYGQIYNKYTYNLEGVDVSRALKDGYSFCKMVINASNPKAPTVDQIVINNKFEIVLSLTGDKGLKLDFIQKSAEGTLNDLLLDCVDDIIYVPTQPYYLRVMNKKGKLIFENKEYVYVSAIANNGMIVCRAHEEGSDEIKYVVFTYGGRKVFDGFKDQYQNIKEIEMFRGDFALVKPKVGDKYALMSKQGIIEFKHRDTENDILHDVAKTSNNQKIYEQNIYMYSKDGKYGVKRLIQNEKESVVREATFDRGTILYRLLTNPNKVFVFEYVAQGDNKVVYILHEVR